MEMMSKLKVANVSVSFNDKLELEARLDSAKYRSNNCLH